jgi:hypothetical protein
LKEYSDNDMVRVKNGNKQVFRILIVGTKQIIKQITNGQRLGGRRGSFGYIRQQNYYPPHPTLSPRERELQG